MHMPLPLGGSPVRPPSMSIRVRVLLAVVTSAVIFAVLPAKADAGRYSLDTCVTPGHRTLDHGPWTSYEQASDGTFVDTCGGSPARFGVRDGNDTLSGERGWVLDAPAGISIREARYWYAIDHGGTDNGLVTFPIGCSSLRSCSDTAEGDLYEYPAGTDQIRFGMRCSRASCLTGNNAEFLVYGSRVTLEEFLLPTASLVGGSALADAPLAGVRTVSFEAADGESGIHRIEAYLNGVQVGTRSYTGECPHESWDACPRSRSGDLTIDTTLVPDGRHALELVAIDAAGNERRVAHPAQLHVDNVPAPANTVAPSITGDPREGAELTAVPGDWSAVGLLFTYRWERCVDAECDPVAGETRQAYRVREGDVGRRLRVVVNGANAEGSAEAASPLTTEVAAAPKAAASPAPQPAPGSPPAGPSFAGAPAVAPVLNGTNASARARLRAWIGADRKRTVRTRFAARHAVRGQLVDERGRSIERADVTFHERRAGASGYRVVGSARTGEDGRFTWRTGRSPSRLIKAGYSHLRGSGPNAWSAPIRVNVAAPVSLGATKRTRNRGTAAFRGRLAGGSVPRGGVVVEMQALTGKRWRTFATTRVRRANGRFVYRYRFTRTHRTRSYRFRARVRKQAGFPFATGSSPTVRVHVTGGR